MQLLAADVFLFSFPMRPALLWIEMELSAWTQEWVGYKAQQPPAVVGMLREPEINHILNVTVIF